MLNNTRQLFGTDGVRGQANQWPMTPDLILKLAMAAGTKFFRGDHRHCVVIGKDTRLSGYMVESALTAGFVSIGMDVVLVGPLPTPAVAMLTRSLRADLGVMISASHNPYLDNGIKFFGPDGYKLSDDDELEIEDLVTKDNLKLAHASLTGKARRLEDAPGRYIEYAKATFSKGLRLDGLKIVVDCAHGAAYKVAPTVLWELGADIIPMGVAPTGSNINVECGATSLEQIQKKVIETQANLGIALDGDADRLIMLDEKGAIIDGDQLMALIATSWNERGALKGNAVVSTLMSNLGLERYLVSQKLRLIRTAVGDRYVLEAMRKEGCNIGGEQSGHIILSDYSTTGDGLIAALQVLGTLVQKQKSMSEISRAFNPSPQVLESIKVSDFSLLYNDLVCKVLNKSEKYLTSIMNGRLLVRKSGTEPLIRVMAEGDDESILRTIVDEILEVIQIADKKAVNQKVV